jgi:hypothetical protein
VGLTLLFFLLANIVFAHWLKRYRRSRRHVFAGFSPWLEAQLRQANFLKLCFVFAACYFSAYVIYNHTGIGCDDLDKDAQCQCYAHEVMKYKRNAKQQQHWAQNGARMCPDSKFFTETLNQLKKQEAAK